MADSARRDVLLMGSDQAWRFEAEKGLSAVLIAQYSELWACDDLSSPLPGGDADNSRRKFLADTEAGAEYSIEEVRALHEARRPYLRVEMGWKVGASSQLAITRITIALSDIVQYAEPTLKHTEL